MSAQWCPRLVIVEVDHRILVVVLHDPVQRRGVALCGVLRILSCDTIAEGSEVVVPASLKRVWGWVVASCTAPGEYKGAGCGGRGRQAEDLHARTDHASCKL